ncbi:hypothetical protein [Christiangramia portivictoriae]|uniref:hypothetical protein n=1 Tax=Christiangramia portivictoriae TaxID=326069 RepID=UPI00047DE09F|nr:hypothetical protein [Christiangramia portivictoriae]
MKKLIKKSIVGNWKITEKKITYIKNVKPTQEIYLEDLSSKLETRNGTAYSWPIFIGGMDWCSFEDAINLLKVIGLMTCSYDNNIGKNTINEIYWVHQDKLAG